MKHFTAPLKSDLLQLDNSITQWQHNLHRPYLCKRLLTIYMYKRVRVNLLILLIYSFYELPVIPFCFLYGYLFYSYMVDFELSIKSCLCLSIYTTAYMDFAFSI